MLSHLPISSSARLLTPVGTAGQTQRVQRDPDSRAVRPLEASNPSPFLVFSLSVCRSGRWWPSLRICLLGLAWPALGWTGLLPRLGLWPPWQTRLMLAAAKEEWAECALTETFAALLIALEFGFPLTDRNACYSCRIQVSLCFGETACYKFAVYNL